MPKKNKEDIKTNDIIEIEEFSETSDNEEKSVVKPKKTKSKPDTKKKVKVESESEEESSEEEPPKKNKSKSKRVVESPVKKPISQKRLDALQRGREKAAKIRAEKKKLELESIKKQLWEDFNGKVKDTRVAGLKEKEDVAAEPPCKEPSSKALEHISKMKSSLPQEPLKLGGNAVVRTFSKIK
jgi:hypothetical protein